MLNLAVKISHPRQLINNLPPLAWVHRNNAGHIPLQDHVVAIGVNTHFSQLTMQLRQRTGHIVDVVGTCITVVFGVNTQPTRYLPRLSLAKGKRYRHARLRFARTLFKTGRMHQIGELLGPQAPRGRQAQSKQNGIENIRLTRAIRPRDDRQTGQQRYRCRLIKRFKTR